MQKLVLQLLTFGWLSSALEDGFVRKMGQINEPKSFFIDPNKTMIITYNIGHQSFFHPKLRIKADVLDRKKLFEGNCFISFSISQLESYTRFRLPFTGGNGHYSTYEQEVCRDNRNLTGSNELKVTVNSCLNSVVETILTLMTPLETATNVGSHYTTMVSAFNSKNFRFYFPEGVKIVTIKIWSDSYSCMVVSVQKPVCSVPGRNKNIQEVSYWRNMEMGPSYITVQKKDFPDGFHLAFVVSIAGTHCQKQSDIKAVKVPESGKRVWFEFENLLEKVQFDGAVAFPFIFHILLLALTLIFFICVHIKGIQTQMTDTFDRPSRKFHMDVDLESDPAARNWMVPMIFVIIVAYATSTLQLTMHFILHKTGTKDMCHYNYFCSYQNGDFFLDFNYFYSNTGYIIYGFATIFFVQLRKSALIVRNNSFKIQHLHLGTFEDIEMQITLGVALIMEGFLSGLYHLCPNQYNFQLDTAFVFAMIFFGYLMILHSRHGIIFHGIPTMLSFVILVSFVAVGSYESASFGCKILLSVLHIVGTFCVQLNILHSTIQGYDRLQNETNTSSLTKKDTLRYALMWDRDSQLSKEIKPSIFLFWSTLIANGGLFVVNWTLLSASDCANQVLVILIANQIFYSLYYTFMKFIRKEIKISKTICFPLICGTLAVAFLGTALINFGDPSAKWELPTADSRFFSIECSLFGFFDGHGLWHMLSPPALFFMFMTIITLDDNLSLTERSLITVF